MKKTIVFTIFFLCLYANVAYAYSKCNHKKITIKALNEFKQYSELDFNKDIIVKSCKGEDNLSLSRAWNWHFLHPKKKLSRYWLSLYTMNRSMINRFDKLDKKLKRLIYKYKNTNSERKRDKLLNKISKRLGQVIHYLQDVSVPAHVIPIYHGPGKKDRFDKHEFDPASIEDDNYADLRHENGMSLEELRRMSADNTLESVYESNAFTITKNDVEIQVTWEVFWGKPEKTGFSDYGILGNNFGEPEIIIDEDKYLVTDEVYSKFFKKRYEEAINITIRALFYVQEQLTN